MLTRGGQLRADSQTVIAADYGPSTPEGIVLPELLTTQAVLNALESATDTRLAED
jgi:hypothetical protein